MVDYIPRQIESTLLERSGQYPVVTVLGPRQSGKTTLVRKLFPDHSYVNLELPDDRLLAQNDPWSFFKRYPEPLIIDEIQRVPSLLSYIQVMVDEDRKKRGRFILTGSQQLDLRAAVSQSLAGRTALLKLLPLSLSELAHTGIRLDRDEYLYRGFMPELYESELSPTTMYSNYYQTYVERDVRQFANIRNLVAFETFLRLLAGRIGQVVNLSDLAGSTGMSSTTLGQWLGILEASFILFRLPPYFENFGKRLIKSPKVYFVDPGLAAYLLGIKEPAQAGLGPYLGGLFENLVIVEALKARYSRGDDTGLFFFRDSGGLEVDLLVEGFERLVPVEIKASRTFSPDFCRSLEKLRSLNPKITPGIVIYAGERGQDYQGNRVVSFMDTERAIMESLG
jgi:predicted AAA+ superfamily ATPase